MNKKVRIKRFLVIGMYYSLTAYLLVYSFRRAFFNGEPLEVCFLKLLYSFLILDMICSVLEDIPKAIAKGYKNFKNYMNKRKEEKRVKEAERLQQEMKEKIQKEEEKQREVLSGNEEFEEIQQADMVYERLKSTMEQRIFNKQITEKLQNLLEEIHLLLEILREDKSIYEKAKYMLRVCLPELENITNTYIDVLKITTSEEKDSSDEYLHFLEVFQQYILSIREEILNSTRTDLEVNTSVMENVMKNRM